MTSIDPCRLAGILISAQRGDRVACEALASLLFTDLSPLVARAARAATHAGAELEDVRQDTYLLLVEPNTLFDPARGGALAYCFDAARSAANFGGIVRAQARRGDEELETLQDEHSLRSAYEDREELAAAHAVDGALFDLLMLIEFEGVTAKAAAAQLGQHPSKVCRALQEFRARCEHTLRPSAAAA